MHKAQQGVALIEFALTISVLLTIVFGITEFGRAVFQYDTLAKAARDAARHLSTKAPGDAVSVADATCLAVYGNPTCSGAPLASGLTTAMVSVCDAVSCAATHQAQGSAPVANLVTLMIGCTTGGTDALTNCTNNRTPYTFNSMVPFVVPNIPFGAISVTMRQVL